MTYKEIVSKVSQDTGIPENIVDKAYKAYWFSIRDTIKKLPLKEDLSKEEFNKLKTNFNIPSLGKLCCTYDRYKGVKKRFEHIKNLREKNEKANKGKTDV